MTAAFLLALGVITHESMWMTDRVGAPQPAPDGAAVAFVLQKPSYDESQKSTDIWLAREGEAPRQLTFTKGAESGVAWSPDGRSLAFTAKREGDESSQVYVLPLTGGEAQRITAKVNDAGSPRWSPDGRWILFTAKTGESRKDKVRVYDGFPVRHWDKWLDERRTALFIVPAAGGDARELPMPRALTGVWKSSGEEIETAWAPDSQSVVFAASANRSAAAYANVVTHLYRLTLDGTLTQITNGDAASYSKPMFAPGGTALYALESREGDELYSLSRLVRFGWPQPGKPAPVTGAFDRSVESVGFSAAGDTVYFTAEDAGHEKLYAVDARGGEVRAVVDLKTGCYSDLAIAADRIYANWESAIHPKEIVRIDAARRAHTPVTQFNAGRARELDIRPLLEFTFTSKAGRQIHNMVALPPGFDEKKKYPLLVLLHGGPHSMWRDQWVYRWNYHLLAAPGYVVLLTNYTGSTGYGEKFAQAIKGDPLRGPALEVNEAADAAIAKYPFIDASRQAAGGASYGGHLANWLQATTTRYKCLISHAGLINLESQWGTSDSIWHRELSAGGPVWEQGRVWREQNPIRFAKNFRTPMLVTAGENDYRVPVNQALENWSVLQRLRIPSRLVVFGDENHWVQKAENSRTFYKEVHEWLARWLK